MSRLQLRAAFTFFCGNAGYCEPPGRAVCAVRLARAEQRAEAMGLRVIWEDDPEPWDGDCPRPRIVACAHVPDADGHVLAALGGIGLDSWRDAYVRVAEAELYAEALDALDTERDRAACVEAAALQSRATYAMNAIG